MGPAQRDAFIPRAEGLQVAPARGSRLDESARAARHRESVRSGGSTAERGRDLRSRLQERSSFRLNMPMKARVFVTLKPSVFDPQGQTIADALHSMGYGAVGDVRQGKYFELEVASGSAEQARTVASEVADKLLANPVIESYRIEIEA